MFANTRAMTASLRRVVALVATALLAVAVVGVSSGPAYAVDNTCRNSAWSEFDSYRGQIIIYPSTKCQMSQNLLVMYPYSPDSSGGYVISYRWTQANRSYPAPGRVFKKVSGKHTYCIVLTTVTTGYDVGKEFITRHCFTYY